MRVLYDLKSGVPGVRLATEEDEDALFALLLQLHAENGLFRLNRDKVIQGIQWATKRQGGIIFCIDDPRGSGVVASLGMCVTSDWYSDDEYLLERWNFVHPDYRRTDYARKLLDQAKWCHHWFKQQGISLPLQVGINSFDRTQAKIRMYARHMPCIGAFFLYGDPPLQVEKARTEARRIEELNKLRSSRKIDNDAMQKAVEEVVRAMRKEAEHV
jgi:GNAT superfamily N-acetyltransferase